MSVNDIYVITFVGIAATLFIDLYAFLLAKVFKIPSLNFCLVGRWGLGLLDGKFMHQNIAASPVKHFECVFGWCVHYFIGVLFSFLFILLVGIAWLEQPTLIAACIFGLASVSMPFFVMQPALGMGIMATKTANPFQARLKSSVTHLLFGVGLYLSAQFIQFI
ncbi:DUF2938 domain-containing protein [Pseudoalteromonas gelatinilytica]|uniref:DUF2938 domain-containing protein n=1 Tax=Pseudoalteromonas gelatinilytica TaxID=1703256 RepID=A0A3A3F317_9GAMM|nr:DUF2938 domain-containing protein [Pseudoalteromonas profundi]RJF35224.1 DUF2938 domain-containing protein [Pseudoalteromonas profundi]